MLSRGKIEKHTLNGRLMLCNIPFACTSIVEPNAITSRDKSNHIHTWPDPCIIMYVQAISAVAISLRCVCICSRTHSRTNTCIRRGGTLGGGGGGGGHGPVVPPPLDPLLHVREKGTISDTHSPSPHFSHRGASFEVPHNVRSNTHRLHTNGIIRRAYGSAKSPLQNKLDWMEHGCLNDLEQSAIRISTHMLYTHSIYTHMCHLLPVAFFEFYNTLVHFEWAIG